jgi:hypothetical protein
VSDKEKEIMPSEKNQQDRPFFLRSQPLEESIDRLRDKPETERVQGATDLLLQVVQAAEYLQGSIATIRRELLGLSAYPKGDE